MKVGWKTRVVAGLLVLMGILALPCPAQPANRLTDEGYIREWVLIGPFPNKTVQERFADGSSRTGYHDDFLAELGGEAVAVLEEGTTVTHTPIDGESRTAVAVPGSAAPDGSVDFREPFDIGARAAYAFSYVESDKARMAHFAFGSNDCAKVWVNGELVHAFWNEGGRGCVPWQDEFEVNLHPGKNPVMVKVEDCGGSRWEFVLEVYDPRDPEIARRLTQRRRRDALRQFQSCEVEPEYAWQRLFPPGEFPDLRWDKPLTVEHAMGKFPLAVRWYNNHFDEVATPDQPGRYAAVVDGTTPDGLHIRRAQTFYCHPDSWHPWAPDSRVAFSELADCPFDAAVLRERAEQVESELAECMFEFMATTSRGAAVAAALAEMKPLGREPLPTDTPQIADADFHVALKRKLLKVEDKYKPLAFPADISVSPAPALREGTFAEAGVEPAGVERIRAMCKMWYAETREPFVVLLARHGVIFFHEAFGNEPDRPVDLDTPMALASLTKLLSGLLFAQFVDQGLIEIDDPVGEFLPDFPMEGGRVLTLRHCFTHTSGLSGHAEWGGLQNPWLDNVVANGAEYLNPGQAYEYNGVGLDLAGKVMEVVGGKCTQRLMYENLFEPLGVRNFTVWDLGFSARVSAEELARFGQLLLNRGAYGNRRFFSPATFEQFLPRPLDEFYPGVKEEYGMGITWMRTPEWLTKSMGDPVGQRLLSDNTIGHGAASGAILRVDLDNDLVVAQVRNAHSTMDDEYTYRFIRAIAASLLE